ncbi:hypothetical protein [Bradyrhizobium sp. JYMT SZCCT0428]|uniref:hypothetical protein n=1 Tax=Bradyrhizobium sp. JYMT SZCCT0428 TaxID=2807673 RepID=UPI001BA49BED|nr:hypothetical protein [Bradyrhizobium sp. JYMT SZCCT0428]MBR1157025.1 hypothetical protein [Bradyrhizobium sp. JYMT SZCCT0428]
MSFKPKTRILVETQDGRRELFSIIERNGDLGIFLRHAINHEDHIRGDVPIVTEKFSVHRSLHSAGTTIKRETRVSDGTLPITSASFITDSKTHFLFPIFGQYAPKLSPDRYSPVLRAKDQILNLTELNELTSTLVYSVFASTTDRVPPPYPDTVGSSLSIEFSTFRITIYFAFINLGAISAHDLAFVATSPEQVTNTPVRPTSEGVPSATDEDAGWFIDYFSGCCTRKFRERILKSAGDDYSSTILQMLDQRSRMVLKMPFAQIETFVGSPVVFESSLPTKGEQPGTILSVRGLAFGKLFLDSPNP